MKQYQVWLKPETRVKGSRSEWTKEEVIEAKNRKLAVQQLKGKYWELDGTKRVFSRQFKIRSL